MMWSGLCHYPAKQKIMVAWGENHRGTRHCLHNDQHTNTSLHMHGTTQRNQAGQELCLCTKRKAIHKFSIG